MESSKDLIGVIPHHAKYRNSVVAIAIGRRGTRSTKQYSGHSIDCDFSSPVAVNFGEGNFCKSEVSARKLGAGLWQRQRQHVQLSRNVAAKAFQHGSFPSTMPQLANGNVKITFPHYDKSEEKIEETKDQLRRKITILRTRNGLQRELESCMPRLNKGSKEVATKWNPNLNEACNEFTMIHSRDLQLGDHNSVVTTLLEELLQTQRSINKLKAEQKSTKKNVEIFLQNTKEEKVFWKQRERHKMKATFDELNAKLERERRGRERTELLVSKLVHELSEAKSLVKHFKTNYEKEKKERELMEEMCEELAMQIGEDKAKLEVMVRESRRIWEEVEEERKMMQIAELWREERVQMKLSDAQLFLEDKYNQLVQQLGDSLQMFLLSRGVDQLGTEELEDAEWIKQDVASVNIQRLMDTIL